MSSFTKKPVLTNLLPRMMMRRRTLTIPNTGSRLIKVAHSIKEIILGMKNEPVSGDERKEIRIKNHSRKKRKTDKKIDKEKPAKTGRRKLISVSAVVVLLLIAALIVYPKIFKRNTLERLRASGEKISVVVMPFLNMTNNVSWDIWQTGIQSEIINNLSKLEELRVLQTVSINEQLQKEGITNTNYTSITSSIASKISKILGADVFITEVYYPPELYLG